MQLKFAKINTNFYRAFLAITLLSTLCGDCNNKKQTQQRASRWNYPPPPAGVADCPDLEALAVRDAALSVDIRQRSFTFDFKKFTADGFWPLLC